MVFDDRLPDESWFARLREANSPLPPGRIGPYEVVSEVSRGGQGVVFRARQPGTHRQVALKRLIGGRLAGGAARSRFEREIEAVCALNHDNIVTVFGVETIDAEPVLAMEWIDGDPIDVWARASNQPLKQILDVFLKVCAAVQHAHQRGVIHRDLKPTNILVDAAGVPHVLDFGLAKAIAADDSAAARLTLTMEFLGTPAYAAPEQLAANGASIDVRSDVYSLGAILYELLCGQTPHHQPGGGVAALVEARRHSDPKPPSAVRAGLERDLDLIAMKALRPDAAQRYQSVDALSADLRRYLEGEPVLAHPPSLSYQLRKLFRRHRLPFAFAAGIVLLIVAFSVLATVLAVRLESERQAAIAAQQNEAEAREATERVNRFLTNMLAAAQPRQAQGHDVTVSEIVDKAAEQLDGRFTDQPGVEASIRLTLGETLWTLGRHADADQQLTEALALARIRHGDGHTDVGRAFLILGNLRRDQGRLEEAVEMYEQAIDVYRALPDERLRLAATLDSLGTVHIDRNDLAAAETFIDEALEIRTAHPDARTEDVLQDLLALSSLEFKRGRVADAEKTIRRAYDLARDELGDLHELTIVVASNLSLALKRQGKAAEALPFVEQALAAASTVFGETHPRTLLVKSNRASLLQELGEFDQAESQYRNVLAELEQTLGLDNPTSISASNNLASLLHKLKRHEEAESLLRDTLVHSTKVFGRRHPDTAIIMGQLGAAVRDGHGPAGHEEARRLLLEALEIFEEKLPADHPYIQKTREQLDAFDQE